MKVEWKEITRNCWTASLPGGVTLSVDRNRSWKTLRDDKPFKITVFGNRYVQETGYAELDEAQQGAEQIAKKIVLGLVEWTKPPMSKAARAMLRNFKLPLSAVGGRPEADTGDESKDSLLEEDCLMVDVNVLFRAGLLAGVFFIGVFLIRQWLDHRQRHGVLSKSSSLGFSVKMDCRACGQINRVPSHRFRDRPLCGRCKERLMPRKTVIFIETSSMEGRLRSELEAVWTDEDRLWQSLADHAVLESKRQAEEKNPGLHAVN